MMVLKTLTRGTLHGYAIAQLLRQLSEDILQVEEGSLYPALQRLELNGWIEGEWGLSANNRRARFYKLTADGRKQVGVRNGAVSPDDCRHRARHGAGVMLRRWQRRLRYWLHRGERARLLREEMEIHLEMKIQELMEDGMTEAGRARRRSAPIWQRHAAAGRVARNLDRALVERPRAGLRLCRPNPPPAARLRRGGRALRRAGHRRLLADFRHCQLCALPSAAGG